MSRLNSILLSLLFLTVGCQPKEQNADVIVEFSFDWKAIGKVLITQMNLEPGERVVLVAQPGQFDPLVPVLKEGIENKGAIYLGAFSTTETQPQEWNSEFIEKARELNNDELLETLSSVDLGVMLPGAVPTDNVYGVMQNVLKTGKNRTIHFHWSGAYTMDGLPKEIDEEVNRKYQEVLLKTDYGKLAVKQKEFDEALRNNWVQVTTPEGTNIKFQIGDRPVTKQDGDASKSRSLVARNLIDREIELPAGAIRVAPMEETVEGIIVFPDSDWGGTLVYGLQMVFKNGKVVGIAADSGAERVTEILDAAGEAGYSFREFALGMNPELSISEMDNKWIPYYGYGAGIVRLSLGDNTELGGNVSGPFVRWNFFTNATVQVADNVWVKVGKLND